MDWGLVINAILVLLGIIAPAVLAWILRGSRYAKEVGDLLTVAGEAISDGKLTSEEIAAILKEVDDIKQLPKRIAEAKK